MSSKTPGNRNKIVWKTWKSQGIWFWNFRGHPVSSSSHCAPNKAFRHVEALFVQGNQVRTDKNKPLFVSLFEVCFDQYELDYLGRIQFLHVEMPYCISVPKCRADLRLHVSVISSDRHSVCRSSFQT